MEKKGLEGLTRYSYDACNRLVEVQYPHILGSLKGEVERFGYDAAGNRTLRETCEQTERYWYDNCNRLTKLEITPKDASKAHSSVSYQSTTIIPTTHLVTSLTVKNRYITASVTMVSSTIM